MIDFLTWLEGTSFAIWVREAPTIWAFSTILTLIFIPVMYEILDRKRYPGDIAVPSAVIHEPGYLKDRPASTD